MTAILTPSSVGGLIKKLHERFPELGQADIASIIHSSTRHRGETAGDFASAKIIDETHAMKLAAMVVRPESNSEDRHP
jgi:hypothetical protein